MIQINEINYSVSRDLTLDNGAIPLTYWTLAPNFGDLLSPYLVEKLTSKPVKHIYLRPALKISSFMAPFRKQAFSYFAVGSILRRVNSRSIVWGSGTFGTEVRKDLNRKATYLAVRGPLTRNLLRIHGISCPDIYGDPALIIPELFNPPVEKRYSIGIVLRWSEKEWERAEESYARAMSVQKNNSAVFLARGKALEKLEHREEALAVYKEGLEVASRKGDMTPLREIEGRILFLDAERRTVNAAG